METRITIDKNSITSVIGETKVEQTKDGISVLAKKIVIETM